MKVLERYDCSGAGDVDTTTIVHAASSAEITLLSGRKFKVSLNRLSFAIWIFLINYLITTCNLNQYRFHLLGTIHLENIILVSNQYIIYILKNLLKEFHKNDVINYGYQFIKKQLQMQKKNLKYFQRNLLEMRLWNLMNCRLIYI